jgi:hypothetical protein
MTWSARTRTISRLTISVMTSSRSMRTPRSRTTLFGPPTLTMTARTMTARTMTGPMMRRTTATTPATLLCATAGRCRLKHFARPAGSCPAHFRAPACDVRRLCPDLPSAISLRYRLGLALKLLQIGEKATPKIGDAR